MKLHYCLKRNLEWKWLFLKKKKKFLEFVCVNHFLVIFIAYTRFCLFFWRLTIVLELSLCHQFCNLSITSLKKTWCERNLKWQYWQYWHPTANMKYVLLDCKQRKQNDYCKTSIKSIRLLTEMHHTLTAQITGLSGNCVLTDGELH